MINKQYKAWEVLGISEDRWFNMESLEDEEWRDILNFGELYQISNFGRVKSISRLNSYNRNIIGRILKLNKNQKGYAFVCLSKYKPKHNFAIVIHRLVLNTFLPKMNNNYTQVNHINGIKIDNRLENLEWVTASENINHAYKLGLVPDKHGEACGHAKLKRCEVIEARRLHKTKLFPIRLISQIFKMSVSGMEKILYRNSWNHI